MPKINQYRIVKAQVDSFKQFGFNVLFDVQGYHERYAAKIQIITDTKSYRFSETNWDFVSSQLAKLYKSLKYTKTALSLSPFPEQNGE